jgi:hypothetical protein
VILLAEWACCTHESKFDTYAHECDLYMLEFDSYTQSVICTCSVTSTGKNVIQTHTSVISTRKKWISKRRVRSPYAECDLYMQSVISTSTSVVSTRTRLVSTRIVRFSHEKCGFTRRVCTHESKFDTDACEYDTHEL